VRGSDGILLICNASKMKLLKEILLVRLLAMLLKELPAKSSQIGPRQLSGSRSQK
jgi:hypothetical protein